MIRAVFVDASGVLIKNHLPDIYARYEREHGIDRQVFRGVFHFLHSGIRSQADLNKYLASINLAPETWKSFTYDFQHSEGRNEILYQILTKAKQKRIKIVITSNNIVGLKDVLARYGLSGLPDLVITSAEIGFTKPDPAFWRYALKETEKTLPGIKPSEILVIDDHPENVQSALSQGFQSLYYGSDTDAIRDTKNRLDLSGS